MLPAQVATQTDIATKCFYKAVMKRKNVRVMRSTAVLSNSVFPIVHHVMEAVLDMLHLSVMTISNATHMMKGKLKNVLQNSTENTSYHHSAMKSSH